jgi:hypothetical protein
MVENEGEETKIESKGKQPITTQPSHRASTRKITKPEPQAAVAVVEKPGEQKGRTKGKKTFVKLVAC